MPHPRAPAQPGVDQRTPHIHTTANQPTKQQTRNLSSHHGRVRYATDLEVRLALGNSPYACHVCAAANIWLPPVSGCQRTLPAGCCDWGTDGVPHVKIKPAK